MSKTYQFAIVLAITASLIAYGNQAQQNEETIEQTEFDFEPNKID